MSQKVAACELLYPPKTEWSSFYSVTFFKTVPSPSPPLLPCVPRRPVTLSQGPGGQKRIDNHLHFNLAFDILRVAA